MIAEVLSVKPHPKADRLKVVDVDWGTDMSVVVTNAANVEEGMKVVFAVRPPPQQQQRGGGARRGGGEEAGTSECAGQPRAGGSVDGVPCWRHAARACARGARTSVAKG